MPVQLRVVLPGLSLLLASCAPLQAGSSAAPRRIEPRFDIPASIPDTLFYLEFVVGLDGHPEAGTLRFLDARDRAITFPQAPGFVRAVWDAVRQWEYEPGTYKGAPVRTLVRQPVIHPRTTKADSASTLPEPLTRVPTPGEI